MVGFLAWRRPSGNTRHDSLFGVSVTLKQLRSPTQIDYSKKGSLILTSLLEDLVMLTPDEVKPWLILIGVCFDCFCRDSDH